MKTFYQWLEAGGSQVAQVMATAANGAVQKAAMPPKPGESPNTVAKVPGLANKIAGVLKKPTVLDAKDAIDATTDATQPGQL